MSDLATLDLIENIPQAKASPDLIAADTAGFRPAGVRRSRRSRPPIEYRRNLLEATGFVEDVFAGDIPMRAYGRRLPGGAFNARDCSSLEEALATSDFPQLFGDIIDRQLLARYAETVPTYRAFAHISTVADFRTVKRFAVDGSEATLAVVGQGDEYPESKLSDLVFSYAVSKFGRRLGLFWEALVNDDLDAFASIPDRLARACHRTAEKFATSLFVSSTGPNATFFTAGNKNKLTGAGSALSITSLQSAFTLLLQQVDAEGEPIQMDAVVLVVPPSLEIIANNILNATELWLNAQGGDTTSQVHTVNWMRNRVTLAVDYYLPLVDTTSGSTAWYLFASPQSTRPALELGFLRGHEEPEIFRKIPNSQRIGGGEDMVDFDNDTVDFKTRMVLGGTLVDFRSAVASVGV